MKNIEWLKEEVKKVKLIDEPHELNKIYYDEVLELIDQLDTPELPEIPFFVAEYIKETKDDDLFELLGELSDSTTSQNMKKEHRLYFWIKNNEQMFFKAMALGYTVEEKKYTVLIGQATESTGLFLSKAIYQKEVTLGTNLDYFYSEESDTHLTEEEIKSFKNGIYWAFAKEVTE